LIPPSFEEWTIQEIKKKATGTNLVAIGTYDDINLSSQWVFIEIIEGYLFPSYFNFLYFLLFYNSCLFPRRDQIPIVIILGSKALAHQDIYSVI